MNNYCDDMFNNLEEMVNDADTFGGDTTGAMVDAIFQSEEAAGASPHGLHQIGQLRNNLVPLLGVPLTSIPIDKKWEMLNILGGIGKGSLIFQGQILEILSLDYPGNRKQFYDDVNNRTGLKPKAIDDRRRVFRVLNALFQRHNLTWPEAAAYVLNLPFILWREITQKKHQGRWEWRDGKVYLTGPCVGSGHELSEYIGSKGDKSDNLLRAALRERVQAPSQTVKEEDDETMQGICPSPPIPCEIQFWDFGGTSITDSRHVRGVNVVPAGEQNDTGFTFSNTTFSCWYECYSSNGQTTRRKLHFYDPHFERWEDIDLPEVTGEEEI